MSTHIASFGWVAKVNDDFAKGSIEVTPDMIEAGRLVVGSIAPDAWEWMLFHAEDRGPIHEVLVELYREMEHARRKASASPQTATAQPQRSYPL